MWGGGGSDSFNLQGTEVLCGPGRGPFYNIEFMHGHGQFSNKLYNAIKAQCPVNELKKGPMSPECSALVSKMSKEIGGYYGYNLYKWPSPPAHLPRLLKLSVLRLLIPCALYSLGMIRVHTLSLTPPKPSLVGTIDSGGDLKPAFGSFAVQ